MCTDRRLDWATHQHNKQRSNSVKFHCMLFYVCRYTTKLLLAEMSVHKDRHKYKYFLVWTSSSVNKSISSHSLLLLLLLFIIIIIIIIVIVIIIIIISALGIFYKDSKTLVTILKI